MSATEALPEAQPQAGLRRARVSILMHSGTEDRFLPLGLLAQSAAALGMEVDVFVTGFALLGFIKGRRGLPFPAEFAPLASEVACGLERTQLGGWDGMLRQARKLGARVHVCSTMCSVMGLKRDDFGDLVDDMLTLARFVHAAENGQTFFI